MVVMAGAAATSHHGWGKVLACPAGNDPPAVHRPLATPLRPSIPPYTLLTHLVLCIRDTDPSHTHIHSPPPHTHKHTHTHACTHTAPAQLDADPAHFGALLLYARIAEAQGLTEDSLRVCLRLVVVQRQHQGVKAMLARRLEVCCFGCMAPAVD